MPSSGNQEWGVMVGDGTRERRARTQGGTVGGPGAGQGQNPPMTPDVCSPPAPDYFVDHMGDYEDVLASLETLNHSVLKAMGYTKKVSGV